MDLIDLELSCWTERETAEYVNAYLDLLKNREILKLLPHQIRRNQHVLRINLKGTAEDLHAWADMLKDQYPALTAEATLLKEVINEGIKEGFEKNWLKQPSIILEKHK